MWGNFASLVRTRAFPRDSTLPLSYLLSRTNSFAFEPSIARRRQFPPPVPSSWPLPKTVFVIHSELAPFFAG